METYLQRCAWP